MTLPWRYAYASVIGTSHTKSGLPCQDSCACRELTAPSGETVLVAAVSDGAGSADLSQIGSQLACELFVGEITSLLETNKTVEDVTKELCQEWLNRFQREIAVRAEDAETMSRSYACTFLAAVVGANCTAFCQIGDGAIVVQSVMTPGDYDWVFWPEKGEYENQTYFATDSTAANHLQYSFATHSVNELAIFSDGLQRLALHMETQTAYAPFFRPMFPPLYNAADGYSPELSSALAQFLSSKRVQDQTDDDSTLVLATRLPLSPPASE